MIRTWLRSVFLASLLLAGSSMVWYSLASANDAGPAAVTDVTPVDETPAPVPAVTDAAPTTPAAVAPSEPATVQSPAAARLIDMLIDILSAVLLILVPYFVHRLLAYFEKKTGLELSANMKEKIDALLDKGIAFAEEQGHKALKKREKKLEMSDKLELGAGYVLDLADAADAKDWTMEKVKKMLEARLNETRKDEGVTLSDPDSENVVPE
jgi:hypothetical protein